MEDMTIDKHNDTAHTCNISYKTPEVVEEGELNIETWNLFLEIQFERKNHCYDLMVGDS